MQRRKCSFVVVPFFATYTTRINNWNVIVNQLLDSFVWLWVMCLILCVNTVCLMFRQLELADFALRGRVSMSLFRRSCVIDVTKELRQYLC